MVDIKPTKTIKAIPAKVDQVSNKLPEIYLSEDTALHNHALIEYAYKQRKHEAKEARRSGYDHRYSYEDDDDSED
jgi:hypothetical protein